MTPISNHGIDILIAVYSCLKRISVKLWMHLYEHKSCCLILWFVFLAMFSDMSQRHGLGNPNHYQSSLCLYQLKRPSLTNYSDPRDSVLKAGFWKYNMYWKTVWHKPYLNINYYFKTISNAVNCHFHKNFAYLFPWQKKFFLCKVKTLLVLFIYHLYINRSV